MKAFRTAFAAAILCWFALATADADPLVSRVDAVAIPVSDVDRAVDFYREVLGFRELDRAESTGDAVDRLYGVFGSRLVRATLVLGDERVILQQYETPAGRPLPADFRSNDHWFQHVAIIVGNMPAAYAALRRHGVRHASPGPQRLPDWNPNAGGIEAFYFRDPDGNHLEILAFPPGKGDPRWATLAARPGAPMFLGIDHTAIVVADTDRSLRYYRDSLGLRVAGESDNHGIEQERLNNVFGAHLRITALRAAHGPGIELLEYLSPRTGRLMPADSRANDAWHWQVELTGPDVDSAWRTLGGGRHRIVSPGVVAVGSQRHLLVRDPDGHALLLGEP